MKLPLLKTRVPGSYFLVPLTDCVVEIFPAQIVFHRLNAKESHSFLFDIQPLVTKFEVKLDFGRHRIEVSMHTETGFFSYQIKAIEGFITLKPSKLPRNLSMSNIALQAHHSVALIPCEVFLPTKQSIFLGSLSRKDAVHVALEENLITLIPWFLALTSHLKVKLPFGDLDLFYRKWVAHKTYWEKGVKALFQGFMQGFFAPDPSLRCKFNYPPLVPSELNPRELLALIHQIILSSFIKEEGERILVLPSLPKTYHQGFVEFDGGSYQITFQWSRGMLRQLKLLSCSSKNTTLVFPPSVNSITVEGKVHRLESSTYHYQAEAGVPLKIEAFHR